MRYLNVFLKKYKQMIIGIIIGSVLSTGGVAFAETPSVVFARMMNTIKFKFNGEVKEVPEEYTVLNYKDRTYVPARFIAENLGAEVNWDEKTSTISIESMEREEEIKEEKGEVSNKNYQSLPIKKLEGDVWIHVTGIKFDSKETWVYLEIENKGDVPVQIDQMATQIISEEKIYKQEELRNVVFPYDQTWYNDIRKDDEVTGFIKMPLPKKDEEWKNITLVLKMRYNDRNQKETEVKFDIAL